MTNSYLRAKYQKKRIVGSGTTCVLAKSETANSEPPISLRMRNENGWSNCRTGVRVFHWPLARRRPRCNSSPRPPISSIPFKCACKSLALRIRPRVNVTVASLNRTLFNYGVGRDWYLFGGNGNCGCDGADKGAAWKVGFDGGGRWGSAKIELHELKHRTDVITAAYAALHTDLEIPWKCCIWTFGLRLEWDYTWMQILQGRNDTHLQDANFLVNFGVRF